MKDVFKKHTVGDPLLTRLGSRPRPCNRSRASSRPRTSPAVEQAPLLLLVLSLSALSLFSLHCLSTLYSLYSLFSFSVLFYALSLLSKLSLSCYYQTCVKINKVDQMLINIVESTKLINCWSTLLIAFNFVDQLLINFVDFNQLVDQQLINFVELNQLLLINSWSTLLIS